jgi:hypothetical protein
MFQTIQISQSPFLDNPLDIDTIDGLNISQTRVKSVKCSCDSLAIFSNALFIFTNANLK